MARHENFWGYKNKLKYKYERVEGPVTTYTMSKEELEKYLKDLEKKHSNKHFLYKHLLK